MAKRDRLGRGLGALLDDYMTADGADAPTAARQLPVAAIAPNPFQPRREFDDAELAELAASLAENGLLQPIIVRPAAAAGEAEWELVAGERRWRAAMRLGWPDIAAVIREVDDRTLLVLALVENIQRAQLTALEEAAAYERLAEEFGLSQQAIAAIVGRDRSTVANTLRLLQLPPSVRQLLSDGRLTAGHARALLGIANEMRMAEVALRAADEGWSVRDVEGEAQRLSHDASPGRRRPARVRDPAERRLEEELQRALGTAVKIRRGGRNRGRIEIPFYDAEDFERVFELLSGVVVGEVVS